ncbi:MAG: zinc ABC transporter substrate-binding protein [Bacilli bacterium]|nr:zinc ABC transporter substrate-binding protein [Bacilli bacterium]
MIKKLGSLFLVMGLVFLMSGCDFKLDSMEGIEIYTTNYPTEYITSRLYGEHSKIHSIYPNGINIDNYKLTKKQIQDYSSSDLYVFNGLNEKEKGYVNDMRNKNKRLMIIDTTLYMEYQYGVEELWLDPSNLLMMAQNMKKGFGEYIRSYYLNNAIDKNYEALKIDASNLDAKIKSMAEKADNKVIVTTSRVFKYLEKYGLTVYCLDNGLDSKDISKIKSLINNGSIDYIFVKDGEEVSNDVKALINGTNIQTKSLYMLANISEEKRDANADYFTLMNENLEALKEELYE